MKAPGSSLAQIVTACVAALAALYFLRGVLAPFFLAIVIAIVVDAIADFIHRALPKVPTWTVLVLFGGMAAGLVIFGSGVALHGAAGLVPQADNIISRLQELPQTAAAGVGITRVPDLKTMFATADLTGPVRTAMTGVTGALSSVGLVILFLAFLLASRATLDLKVSIIAASTSRIERVHALLELIARGVQECVLLQAAGAGLIAAASGVVLFAVGLHDALFWTIAIFLVSYLPFIGGFLAGFVPALFALVQFPTVGPAVIILVVIEVINLVVGNLVMPKLQAAGPNVDPTAGILTFSILSVLWGIPGAILASPLTVMLMLLLAHFDKSRWLAVLISNDGKPATSAGAIDRREQLGIADQGGSEPHV
jgi:AI-2 transport protein TqsA